MTDEFYMKRALLLARRGERWVSPNPMVGAVIVKQGQIIGEGYHRRFGGDHAEIDALRNTSSSPAGATIYISLEPCCHEGKTPPCVDSLLSAGIARVIIGMSDPNPLVCGGGVERLRTAGIPTTVGLLEAQCRRLNERFIKFMQTRVPFVTLKFAQTLDGRIATGIGHSRWISSPASLKYAHALRSVHDAIIVGSRTIAKDDPELTVRLVRGRNPLRVVLDGRLRISPDAAVLRNQHRAKTIVFTSDNADQTKMNELTASGIETVVIAQGDQPCMDIGKVLVELGRRNVSSVLVEGGGAVITSVLRHRLADRIVCVIAPKIMGSGIEAAGELGAKTVDDSLQLSIRRIMRKGGDLIIDGTIK